MLFKSQFYYRKDRFIFIDPLHEYFVIPFKYNEFINRFWWFNYIILELRPLYDFVLGSGSLTTLARKNSQIKFSCIRHIKWDLKLGFSFQLMSSTDSHTSIHHQTHNYTYLRSWQSNHTFESVNLIKKKFIRNLMV